eukprot:SAG25_NODE_45_length_19261_cov_61.009815_9_plen_68_part_00
MLAVTVCATMPASPLGSQAELLPAPRLSLLHHSLYPCHVGAADRRGPTYRRLVIVIPAVITHHAWRW